MNISIGRTAYWADKLIPDPKGIKTMVKSRNASVQDIMKAILMADKEAWEDTTAFSQKFDFENINDFKRLWSIVRYDINYKLDAPGFEVIKSPAATWFSGFADCKSKSLFTASVLNNAGLSYFYRFVHYGNKNAGHVYVVVESPLFGEIIMDSVHTSFNEEVPYHFKVDYNPVTGQTFNQIGEISGLDIKKFLSYCLALWLAYKIFFN